MSEANASTFRLEVDPGVSLFVYRWEPPAGTPLKAVLQVCHGMAEHAGRYERLARALNDAGYAVYASDHRGHGKTAPTPDDLGFFGPEGSLPRVVQDQEKLRKRIEQDHPGVPVVMFGHSMGSFIVRAYLCEHGSKVAAAVLSGTRGGQVALAHIGRVVARVERLRLGPRGRSAVLHAMSFGDYNRAFEPVRTESDWLSRDAAEVDKYIADPACGFVLSTQGWVDVLGLVADIEDFEKIQRMPRELPIYVFAGDQDPVGNRARGVRSTLALFKRAGLTRATERFYPGGRHEMLNEINRDEVQRDLIAWLDQTLSARR